jgi:hypothetical protein
MEKRYYTVDIWRYHHGKRYSGLFVDSLDSESFSIDCSDTYTRPEHYDLRVGDVVRWKHNERYLQALIADVYRNGTLLKVALEQPTMLPTDYFPY